MMNPLEILAEWELAKARRIVEAASLAFGVPVERIYARTRLRPIVDARHAAASALVDYAGMGVVLAGIVLGGRDHATIINSRIRTSQLLETDAHFRERYEAMLALMGNPERTDRPATYGEMLDALSGDGAAGEPQIGGGGR